MLLIMLALVGRVPVEKLYRYELDGQVSIGDFQMKTEGGNQVFTYRELYYPVYEDGTLKSWKKRDITETGTVIFQDGTSTHDFAVQLWSNQLIEPKALWRVAHAKFRDGKGNLFYLILDRAYVADGVQP